jgi:class III poly(R)-hydroxyalkanoic acid synthase PhaE subunit
MAGFTESSSAWTQAWLDMQKQYLDTWMKFSGGGIPGTTAPFGAANPLAGSFEQWSRLFGQGMPGSVKSAGERLFDLGKSYLDMSERYWQQFRQGSGQQAGAKDWPAMMQQAFTEASRGFALPGGATDPWSGFATLWGLPLSNWQRMATSFSPFPGEMEKALRPGHAPAPGELTRAMGQYLAVPPIGYTREWQEQQQEWSRLLLDYTHTVQAFGTLLGKVVQRALELFGRRMTEKTGAGESFDGLRGIYNLWIDCGEEAYAEQVAGAEFPQLQADMVNALMRMKRHEQLMLEEVFTALNMPTRREMDTTHRRVYELQQQVCRLQEALEENGDGAPAARQTRKPAATRRPATKKTRASTSRAKSSKRKD